MLVHDEGIVQLGAQIGADGLDVFLPQLVALAELGFGQTLGLCLSGKPSVIVAKSAAVLASRA